MNAPRNPVPAARLREFIEDEARALGFDEIAIARPDAGWPAAPRLKTFVEKGRHGTMEWMAETVERRAHPNALWPQARSVIMLAMNYGPDENPLSLLERRDRAAISVYARNRDYHDVIKGKLKTLAQKFAARTGAEVKVFVDTAPVMEKPLAADAGLGWQGKHTNLVSREFGSWLFLGSIFTAADLEPDSPEHDHCGSCRACLDICPTNAFPAPYQLDARRCISYLTIEHKGPVPHEFRPLMGNRIYGCDDCLAACPWNKFAKEASEAKLAARDDLTAPAIAELLGLDDAGFRIKFSGSPIKRIGRDRFMRNVLIAAGNSGDPALSPHVEALLADPAPLVRGAAVWALSLLADPRDFDRLATVNQAGESDGDVRYEWAHAMETA
ncbi:tRNA epoxyqueuosine(34) reductase QueG [Aliihoeflea aestuarii]|jgi:epoxyqueuosine reductase|uniref:tRNA epoxyqueuosine(34) reductase QueG n=1 Tax=Aliihoeflea aestuarii TaxID=453840 RepID=UPI0020938103|nr:tRNA epoxyqueuosine(34) reductase QueG [Aliihoeflea aestuarii]MCO6390969.1 tRNA epoxyqueuosine(34) reductase QueG [Aliihoeflea aestuarii]